MKQSRALLMLPGLLVLPLPAQALEMEYYTYNGFDVVLSALQRIALVFSDNSYLALFTAFIILGLTLGSMSVALKGLVGVQSHPFSWVWPILLGVVIFEGMVVPKGVLNLYDPVRNQYQAVGGIPDAIVIAAGTFNLIERGVAEVTDTASANPYADEAGGIRYELIYRATSQFNDVADYFVTKSVEQFYSDCAPIALNSAAYSLDLNQLKRNTPDLISALAEMQSESVSTTYYDATDKSGSVMTCTDAWKNHLSTILASNDTYAPVKRNVCGQAGFNINSAAQMAKCDSLLAAAVQTTYPITGGNSIQLLRNAYLTSAMIEAVQDPNPDVAQMAQANRDQMVQGIGMANVANEWLPTIRAVVTAVVYGMIPFLALFIVTPLVGKALFTIFGLLIWISLWGVTDVITHQMAMDQAQLAFDHIRSMQMGIDSILMSPPAALKALAVFGKLRSMGAMMATVLAVALFKFGGQAVSSMANSWSGSVEKSGTASASQTVTPEGRASTVDHLGNVKSMDSLLSGQGFGRMADARAFDRNMAVQETQGLMDVAKSLKLSDRSFQQMSAAAKAGESGGRIMGIAAFSASTHQEYEQAALMVARAEQTQRMGQGAAFESAMMSFGGWDGKTPLSDHQREDMIAKGALNFASIEANERYGKDTSISALKEQTKALYEKAHPGHSLTDAQAWEQVARFNLADQWAKVSASDGNAAEFIGYLTKHQALGMENMKGLFAQADALGISPMALAAADGKMTAIRQTGDYQALAQLTPQELVGAHLTDKVYQVERADALQDLADHYFKGADGKGDLRALLAATTSTDSAHGLSQYLAWNAIASTLGKDQVRAMESSDLAGKHFSLTKSDVQRLGKKLDGLMTPEQRAVIGNGAEISFAFNGKGGFLNVSATKGASVSDNQNLRVDHSTVHDSHRATDTSTTKTSGEHNVSGVDFRGGWGNTEQGYMQQALYDASHGRGKSALQEVAAAVRAEPGMKETVINTIADRFKAIGHIDVSSGQFENNTWNKGDRITVGGTVSEEGTLGIGLGRSSIGVSERGYAGFEHHDGNDSTHGTSKDTSTRFDNVRGLVSWGVARIDAYADGAARLAATKNGHFDQAKFDKVRDAVWANEVAKFDKTLYSELKGISEGKAIVGEAGDQAKKQLPR